MIERRARVCLVTTGQPSTNPRLVKEADALSAAGYHVHVIGAHWAEWAATTDEALLATRTWSCEIIDWRREHSPRLFHGSRLRHWASRRFVGGVAGRVIPPEAALTRVGPELRDRAVSVPADLYIAHNLGALPAAAAAADAHAALLAFDAEDFHSGQLTAGPDDPIVQLTVSAEKAFLPRCAYVTAAAPGIAEAYRALCDIPLPTTVLNVFPLADRPSAQRQRQAGPIRLYWFSQTIGPGRGLETAVEAIGMLPAGSVELHLRGRWQPGFEKHLRSLAASHGVHDARLVSHPPADPREMVRCAAEYDIGLALEPPVSVNNDILLSNKVFTYLLAGCAVVMSRTRGQSQLLPDLGAAAVAFPCDDAAAMAAGLRPWLANEEALRHARDAAWQLGETRYNWDREQQVFLNLVGRTLNGTNTHESTVQAWRNVS